MKEYIEILYLTVAFLFLLISANRLAGFFAHLRLPLITGLMVMGVLIGPYAFNFIPEDAIEKLSFINEIALVFIAFAAGAELHLNEFRERRKSIFTLSIVQVVIIFGVGSVVFFLLSRVIPFTREMPVEVRIVISLFTGVISIARSPASTIAVINELRARGPFTQTSLGTTVLIDVLSILLFSLVFSFAEVLLNDENFHFLVILILSAELLVSFVLGLLLGRVLTLIMGVPLPQGFRILLMLGIGFGIYLFSQWLRHYSTISWGVDFYLEPLLINIIGSFYLANYTRYRREFNDMLENAMPFIYAAFFTLIGASISWVFLFQVWTLAVLLFFLRIVLLFVGSWIGSAMAGDPVRFRNIMWMPFVTQAGVSLGLITVIMGEGHTWSYQFGTILIGTIILNQLIGPALFKWAIQIAGEHHVKAHGEIIEDHEAVIFGYEAQSIALARQLSSQKWAVRVVTDQPRVKDPDIKNVRLVREREITRESLERAGVDKAEAIVTMKTDDENYAICELAYEHFGTPNLVVRLNDRKYFDKFLKLGALIVDPSTAIVSLLDHMVRAPNATSLLLGHEPEQDTADIVLRNRSLHGVSLRHLDLPADILILATRRRGQTIISTGFTRLRLGDVLTVVGSKESIEELRLKLE
jgi:Trk K+ transport system NAD-binding subunit/NhaP-type Na+/H+ or K+/H+ antiporter